MGDGPLVCRHAGVCGGCSLLHLTYAEQIARKESILAQLLPASVRPPAGWRGSLFVPVAGVSGDGPRHFRQKVAFVFGALAGGRGLAMGHYRRGTRSVVSVDECPVHSERGNRIAFAMRDHLAKAGISAAGPALSGILRHLLIRTTIDDREAVAMLVVTRNDKSLRRPVRALLESDDRPDGFFVNIHDGQGPFMVGPDTIRIDGRGNIREQVGGVIYQVSPTAFFQTNVLAAEVLQRQVLESVAGSGRVLDLYCGSGLFSLPLARAGVMVTGIEENGQAVKDAEANARLNGIARSRVRFVAARVEDAVKRVEREAWDSVLLDPPRQGCAPGVIDAVFRRIAPPRVTYVSCNPEALSRELPGVLESGYRVADIKAVDMFPHTDHIETIVRFERR